MLAGCFFGYPMSSIADDFSRAAQVYDGPRRQLIPCFDALYGAAYRLTRNARDAEDLVRELIRHETA